jgi:hypothetical protein
MEQVQDLVSGSVLTLEPPADRVVMAYSISRHACVVSISALTAVALACLLITENQKIGSGLDHAGSSNGQHRP